MLGPTASIELRGINSLWPDVERRELGGRSPGAGAPAPGRSHDGPNETRHNNKQKSRNAQPERHLPPGTWKSEENDGTDPKKRKTRKSQHYQ